MDHVLRQMTPALSSGLVSILKFSCIREGMEGYDTVTIGRVTQRG